MRSADVRSADVRSGEVQSGEVQSGEVQSGEVQRRGAETRRQEVAPKRRCRKKRDGSVWRVAALVPHETVHVAMDGLLTSSARCSLSPSTRAPLARRSGAPELVQDGHLDGEGGFSASALAASSRRAGRAALALSIAWLGRRHPERVGPAPCQGARIPRYHHREA